MKDKDITLIVKNSKNGDFMEYNLCEKIFNLDNSTIKEALLSSLNKKYNKKFDTVYYKEI